MDIQNYIRALRTIYEANANPDLAAGMQKYMRNLFVCYGIYNPKRKELHREFFEAYGFPPDEQLNPLIKILWDLPQRDYQYFGMVLLEKTMKKADQQRIDLYEHMIINKSWWDTVDYIAAWLVGQQFKIYPNQIQKYTNRWMNSGNIWLQRTCVIYQLKYKKETDTKLLTKFIDSLAGSKEFFIRKAIGWALREYSKTDPEWVKNFINSHDLAPLSSREGMKWIMAKGLE